MRLLGYGYDADFFGFLLGFFTFFFEGTFFGGLEDTFGWIFDFFGAGADYFAGDFGCDCFIDAREDRLGIRFELFFDDDDDTAD